MNTAATVANKQIEVQIMGQSYLLTCPVGGESALLDAVERVDTAMCRIRDAGKVKARDRIAVLASLNLAFDLSQKEGLLLQASHAAELTSTQPAADQHPVAPPRPWTARCWMRHRPPACKTSSGAWTASWATTANCCDAALGCANPGPPLIATPENFSDQAVGPFIAPYNQHCLRCAPGFIFP